MISIKSIISQNPDMIASEIDGEAVMMSIEHGSYYGMNPVASSIWASAEKSVSAETICKNIFAQYEISFEQCQKDTMKFIEDLIQKEILILHD